MRRTAALTVLLAIALSGSAAAVADKQFGSKVATGDQANAIASATTARPKSVYVAVIATPAQPVSVKWSLACRKGTKVRPRTGSYTTSSSAKHKLTLPWANPDSCFVSASARLQGSGRLVVRLYKR